MKYMMSGLEPRGEFDVIGAEEQTRRIRRHQEKLLELLDTRVKTGRNGLIFASVGLGPFHGGETFRVTVKNQVGRRLRIDGPFPETKEVLGGFDIIDFNSHEEAIEFAKTKHAHESHVEELRPIREFWWMSYSPSQSAPNVFMLSSVEDEGAVLRRSDADRKAIKRQHQAVGAEYVTDRRLRGGVPMLWVGVRLAESAEAKTIRGVGAAQRITDGPFAETREVIGGFNLVACESIDEAIRWAEKLTPLSGDAIEIRPVDGFVWIYHE